MSLLVDAVRVHKVGVGHAELLRLLVHHIVKGLRVAVADVPGERGRAVTGAFEHGRINQRFDGDFLPLF